MRYFVYFFAVKNRWQHGGEVIHFGHIQTADISVPSWKVMRERFVESTNKMYHKDDLQLTNFHEFANEQDYKDFCG